MKISVNTKFWQAEQEQLKKKTNTLIWILSIQSAIGLLYFIYNWNTIMLMIYGTYLAIETIIIFSYKEYKKEEGEKREHANKQK